MEWDEAEGKKGVLWGQGKAERDIGFLGLPHHFLCKGPTPTPVPNEAICKQGRPRQTLLLSALGTAIIVFNGARKVCMLHDGSPEKEKPQQAPSIQAGNSDSSCNAFKSMHAHAKLNSPILFSPTLTHKLSPCKRCNGKETHQD